MKIDILFFGQLAEITGTNHVSLQGITDTNSLTDVLKESYPALISQPYRIAINNQLVAENTRFEKDCTVALLPPFSGG